MYLHIACLFSVLSIGSCFAAAQQGRPETAPLWEQYAAQPNTHPNVPNCSFAGYRYGQQPIPDRPVVVKAVDFGVTADGKADNAPAIARALKAAADAGGGAVLLPPGTIRAETPIFLRDDNVVLRGAGQDKTTLLFPKPLEKAYGRNFSGSKSAWSWSGGMVWIVPAESQPDRFAGRSNYREGWYGTKKLTKITSTHQRGQKTLTVADASGLRAGQKVLLTLADPGDFSLYSHLAGDIPGTKSYAWARQAEGIVKTDRWQWPVEIEKVSGRTITLAQPLRTDIRAAWQGELTTPGPLVVGAGVEDLTIRFPQTRLSAHLMNPGYNGIYFENAWDCWARRVTIVNTDNGIGTAASKCITVDRFTVTGRDNHHTTFCRNGSHDVLWTRFVVKSKVHHGLNIEGLSSGCVWSAGDMDHGTLDSHRALPFACIRTDIRMRNDGRHGGGSTAGPLFGARFVHWNIEVINGRAHMVHAAEMMPRGAVVGVRGTEPIEGPYPDFTGPMQSIVQADGQRVRPQDLHLAQLHLRTGKVPHHLGRHVELSLARADGKRIVLHWAEPFMTDRTYQIARKAQREAWNDDFATLAGPAWRFEDTDIQPGQN
ncbi:MAG: glycosyl hydrolase family 28-related protein, partial [Planctomycetota bacterium]